VRIANHSDDVIQSQESVSNTQTQPMAAVEPLEDYELLAEGKYLGVQRCASSESLSNRREQREDDREHGIGKLYPTPFNSTGSTRTEFLVGTPGNALRQRSQYHFLDLYRPLHGGHRVTVHDCLQPGSLFPGRI
jgi:hypothetical protein